MTELGNQLSMDTFDGEVNCSSLQAPKLNLLDASFTALIRNRTLTKSKQNTNVNSQAILSASKTNDTKPRYRENSFWSNYDVIHIKSTNDYKKNVIERVMEFPPQYLNEQDQPDANESSQLGKQRHGQMAGSKKVKADTRITQSLPDIATNGAAMVGERHSRMDVLELAVGCVRLSQKEWIMKKHYHEGGLFRKTPPPPQNLAKYEKKFLEEEGRFQELSVPTNSGLPTLLKKSTVLGKTSLLLANTRQTVPSKLLGDNSVNGTCKTVGKKSVSFLDSETLFMKNDEIKKRKPRKRKVKTKRVKPVIDPYEKPNWRQEGQDIATRGADILWKFPAKSHSSAGCNKAENTPSKKNPSSKDTIPITSTMLRDKTCVSKVKYKVPSKGEIHVSKVWSRQNLEPGSLPPVNVMAKVDVKRQQSRVSEGSMNGKLEGTMSRDFSLSDELDDSHSGRDDLSSGMMSDADLDDFL